MATNLYASNSVFIGDETGTRDCTVRVWFNVPITSSNTVSLTVSAEAIGPYTGPVTIHYQIYTEGISGGNDYAGKEQILSFTKSSSATATDSNPPHTFTDTSHGTILVRLVDPDNGVFGPQVQLDTDTDNVSILNSSGVVYQSSTPTSSVGPTWANVYELNTWTTNLQPQGTVATSSNPAIAAPNTEFTIRWGGGALYGGGSYKINVQCTTSGGGGPWNYTTTNEYLNDSFGTARAGYTYKYTITVSNGSGSATTYVRVVANTHQLTVKTNKSSFGTVSGGGAFSSGTSVTVVATPKTGYRFMRWKLSGGSTATSTNTSYTFSMPNADTTATATFAPYPVYIFNGTQWKPAFPYVFNGTTWKKCEVYIFDGTKWRTAKL